MIAASRQGLVSAQTSSGNNQDLSCWLMRDRSDFRFSKYIVCAMNDPANPGWVNIWFSMNDSVASEHTHYLRNICLREVEMQSEGQRIVELLEDLSKKRLSLERGIELLRAAVKYNSVKLVEVLVSLTGEHRMVQLNYVSLSNLANSDEMRSYFAPKVRDQLSLRNAGKFSTSFSKKSAATDPLLKFIESAVVQFRIQSVKKYQVFEKRIKQVVEKDSNVDWTMKTFEEFYQYLLFRFSAEELIQHRVEVEESWHRCCKNLRTKKSDNIKGSIHKAKG